VVERYRQKEGCPPAEDVPDEIMEPYLRDLLDVSLADLRAMSYEELQMALAYNDGRGLARWAREHPHPGVAQYERKTRNRPH
jgi:hypothetical protein